MGKLEHTPGPWRVDYQGQHGGNIIASSGPVANTRWFGVTHKQVMEDYANAHLIAKAPDMLEALQAFVDVSTEEERRLAFNKATSVLSSLRARDGGEGL